LPQLLPNVGLSAAAASAEFPQAFTGTSTGACTLLPDRMPGEPVATPSAPAANAFEPDRERMLVAAAVASTPLPMTCRILVVFL
jgi:hypothetical protein